VFAKQITDCRTHALRIAAIWAITLLAYSSSFRNGLPFDSGIQILRDARVHELSIDNLKLIATKEYWYGFTTTGLYRPAATFSYLVNYAILGSGENPAGYHIVNAALHLANVALVYLLALALLEAAAPAFAIAALWAVHPALTESVANVAGRADLLAAFGVLAALLCHMRSRRAPQNPKWIAGVGIAAAIGIFSKESAAAVVVFLLLYDFTVGRSVPWRERLGSYRALGIVFGIYLILRSHAIGGEPDRLTPFGDNPLASAGFWTARLTALKVFARYLGLLVWPAGLSCDYSYNQIPLFHGSTGDWTALVGLAAVIALVAVAIVSFRRCAALCFFTVFFAVALLPVTNLAFPIGTIMAERFLYVPAIAFAAILVIAFRWATRRWPAARVPAVVLICAAFAARTYARNFDWYDESTLWRSAARTAPESYKAHMGLALALSTAPHVQWDVVDGEIARMLAILDPLPDDRNVAAAYSTAGMCYRMTGDAIAGTPQSREWYEKARVLLERGRRIDSALDAAVLAENRRHGKEIGHSAWLPLYLELGRIYLRLGEPKKALEALEWGNAINSTTDYTTEIDNAYRALTSH
jgi:hypothetical protein